VILVDMDTNHFT